MLAPDHKHIPTIDFTLSRNAKFLNIDDCYMLIEAELIVRLARECMRGVTQAYVNVPYMELYKDIMRLFPQMQLGFKEIPVEPQIYPRVRIFTAQCSPEIIQKEFIIIAIVANIVENVGSLAQADHIKIEADASIAIQVLAMILDMNILPKNITWSW